MPKAEQFRRAGVKAEQHEQRIQEAIKGIRDKKYPTVAFACRQLGLTACYHTVYRRFHGKSQPRLKAHVDQQLLSPTQEKVLHNWIKFLGVAGVPLSKCTIAPKVAALCGRKPARRWIERFIRRNPECTLDRPSKLAIKRARQFNYTIFNQHFESLQTLFDSKAIPPRNLFNAVEIGIQPGLSDEDLPFVTVIETVCADGTSTVRPCFVFSRTHYSEEWFNAPNLDGVLITTSENDWTSEKNSHEWFIQNFIRDAKAHADASKPIVLVYNGHSSHTEQDLLQAAIANNVLLHLLPPHTTRHLQPCDVGAFGPLKHAWNHRCEEVFTESGEGLCIADIVREYLPIREAALEESTIRKAWEKSGVGMDESGTPRCLPDLDWSDFASSILSLTRVQLPASDWEAVTSSSESGSDDERPSEDDSGSRPPARRSQRLATTSAAVTSKPENSNLDRGPTATFSRPSDLSSDTGTLEIVDLDLDAMPIDALKSYIMELQARIKHSEEKAKTARERRDEARANAVLAANHIQQLQGQLNLKSVKK